MRTTGDAEVHESEADGRAYLLDVTSLPRPTTGGVPLALLHMFRPEVMATLPREMGSAPNTANMLMTRCPLKLRQRQNPEVAALGTKPLRMTQLVKMAR